MLFRSHVAPVAYAVVPGKLQLEALVVDFGEVHQRCGKVLQHGRQGRAVEDAVGILVVDIECTPQAVVEYAEVNTDVGYLGGLPGQGRVGELVHEQTRGNLVAERHFAVGIVERLPLVVADGVVAEFTPRCADLEVAEPVDVLHERFLADTPACRYRGEEAPAVLLVETRRTVVAHVHFKEILGVVSVGGAAEP